MAGNKVVKYRPHRSLYVSAIAQMVEIDSLEALRKHILNEDGDWIKPDGVLTIERYGAGIDQRNGWKTHIVLWDGVPVGFTSDELH